MTSVEITRLLQIRFGQRVLLSVPAGKHPRIHIAAQHWRELAEYVMSEPALQLDWLANLSGVDYVADNQMAVIYDLWSFTQRHAFAIKVFIPRDQPVVPSVADLWRAADWHEREVFDLLGIAFEGHPDLRRILCADDWEGFPLRKDYVFPRAYHGIPGSVELDWQQQSHYPKGH